jgi:hypothetical protein
MILIVIILNIVIAIFTAIFTIIFLVLITVAEFHGLLNVQVMNRNKQIKRKENSLKEFSHQMSTH